MIYQNKNFVDHIFLINTLSEKQTMKGPYVAIRKMKICFSFTLNNINVSNDKISQKPTDKKYQIFICFNQKKDVDVSDKQFHLLVIITRYKISFRH